MTSRAGRRLAAILLVVTAGLFVVGVSLESDKGHSEATVSNGTAAEGDQHAGESDESAEERESDEANDSHDEATEGDGEEDSEEILGMDPESPGLVAVGVIVSIALAAGLWFTDKRSIAAAAAAFAALFAVLDIAEVSHQLDENNSGLAALAVAIAIGHAVAALSAGRAALQPDTNVEVP